MSPPNERRRRPRYGSAAPKSLARQSCNPHGQYAPSRFDLSDAELVAHAAELIANGWADWEIDATLDMSGVES